MERKGIGEKGRVEGYGHEKEVRGGEGEGEACPLPPSPEYATDESDGN